MQHAFTHPGSEPLLGRVTSIFRDKIIFQRPDRHVVFVCGGSAAPSARTLRARFLRYSKRNLTSHRVFLAERIIHDLWKATPPTFDNLASFEEIIADISDCIVLFPESPGSCAELGFFCKSDKIRTKVLVVNDEGHENADSFLNLGPIHLVNIDSRFRSAIWINKKNPDFRDIRKRLSNRMATKNRKRFQFAPYSQLQLPQRFFLLHELIALFRPITYDSLVYVVSQLFGKIDGNDKEQIRRLISILHGSDYIKRHPQNDEYLIPSGKIDLLFEYENIRRQAIVADIVTYYRSHRPQIYELLKEIPS
jgi:hypothetical protein